MIPPVVILCGGYGKRARIINKNLPKALIKVGNRPFLYLLIKNLENNGVKKVYICAGYKGRLIKDYLKKNKKYFKIKILYSEENAKNLLGTGGAIKKIYNKLDNIFFVMNGDSFLFLNLKNLYDRFIKSKKLLMMTILKNKDKKQPNNIIKKSNYILYDKEKKKPNMDYIDYGIFIAKKKIFLKEKKKFQLSDFLKTHSYQKKISFMIIKKRFYEIGSYHGYKETLRNINKINDELKNAQK